MGEITHAATGYLTLSFLGMIFLFLLIFTTAFRQYRKTRNVVLLQLKRSSSNIKESANKIR